MGLDTIGKSVFQWTWMVVAILLLSRHGIKADFQYLGCYGDRENDRDLRKSEVTFTPGMLKVADCASECRRDGWPYIGLQKGFKCFCGSKYGTFGTELNTACNYTCNNDREFCGGVTANSVYYAIDTTAENKAARSWVHYTVAKPYDSARQDCVKNDGDLAIVQNSEDIDDVIALFADVELSAQQRKVIIGLFRNPPPDGAFTWTDAYETLDLEAIRDLWRSDEPWQNACTVLDIDTGEFETTSCHAQYPYVCNQAGVADTGNDYPDETSGGDEEEEEEGGASTLALAIVLPIFAFCYGGSCLLYCVHKLHKNCKRKRRKKMLERQEHFSEFEPDTKPINPKEPNSTYGKTNKGLMNQDMAAHAMTQKERNIAMTMSSAMLLTKEGKKAPVSMQVDPSHFTEGPAEESQPEPTTSRQTSPTFSNGQSNKQLHRMTSRGSVQSIGPVVSSRPTTSEAVHINMDDSPPGTADPNGAPPGYYQSTMFQKKAKQVREEKRRNRLLENALREARQRRAREQSGVSRGSVSSSKSKVSIDQTTTHDTVDETTATKPPTPPRPESMKSSSSMKSVKSERSAKSEPPIPVTNHKKKKTNVDENGGNNSGDSLTSLIGDERKTESPDDPTQMSIADIMKVKMMMKARKKRVRKILGT